MTGALRGLAAAALRSRAMHNAGWLFVTQLSNLAVQLITLPLLVRALQPTGYGRYAFFQAVTQYFVIFVDFGFQLTATKRVAELRDEREALNHYFWTVQVARAMLAGAALLVALLLGLLLWRAPAERLIFGVSVLTVLGTVATPTWLFSGLERMGFITTVSLIARAAAIPAIALLVHAPADAWVAAAIVSATSLLAGFVTGVIIVHRRLVGWAQTSWAAVAAAYADAWHLFVANSAISLYLAGNTVVLGAVAPPFQVGLFSSADKIRQFGAGPITPVVGAFFPAVSRALSDDPTAARQLLNRLMWGIGAMMSVVMVVMLAGATTLTRVLLGPQFGGAAPVLRIMAAMPLIVGLSSVFGTLTMVPLGMKRQFSRIVLGSGIVNLGLVAMLGHRFGAIGAATGFLATEIMVTAAMFVGLRQQAIFGGPRGVRT